MFKKILAIVVSITFVTILIPVQSSAQSEESFRMQLESILFSFKNYRFSNISVWKLKDIKDVRKIIRARDEAESLGAEAGNVSEECLKGVDNAVLQTIESEINNGSSQSAVARALIMRSLPQPPQAQFECIYKYYESKVKGPTNVVRSVYIVTTRKDREQLVPNTIIAMIISYQDDNNIKKNINNASPSNIYTYPEVKEFALDPKEYRSSNVYGLLENAFLQGQVEDVTLESQGVGSLIFWFPPQSGVTKSLLAKENTITSYDVQKFKRVSDGQPLDIFEKFNELVVSPDLISWRRYEYPMIKYPDGTADTLSRFTNLALPKYGLELKYGLDGINYPSFWSERVTLSAIWQGVKLGIILPTNGYSSISKDIFNTERHLTYAGVGLAGEADFPLAVIPKSGIFHANFGYVFGDAQEGPIKRNLDPEVYQPIFDDNDYLVRFNAQLHYTFGVAIDDDYMLRFGLGGTMYMMEKWFNNLIVDPETRDSKIKYEMLDDETIGGVSGRIELMTRNVATPYGASIQYFDEALYTNLWLQVPIVENTFSIRIDAKGYFKAFTNTPRIWENKSVFIPMVRFIVNF